MNISSIILLAVIAAAVVFGIYKIRKSKGACEDCDVASCPVHSAENMEK